MSVDTATIDRIVANVLGQLRAPAERMPSAESQRADRVDAFRIADRVITADTLDEITNGSMVSILEKAIVTPAARDVARERDIRLIRNGAATPDSGKVHSLNPRPLTLNAYIVRHTESLARALDDQLKDGRRELLGCPDDAAKRAISDICRGDAGRVLIFAAQAHRAACLANRNEKVKAAVVRDIGDVKHVREQLRANVWCVDPGELSYFELRNLLREIVMASGAGK